MRGTCNPDWGPISWPEDVVQRLRSPGLLIVQVYVYNLHSAPARRPTPGNIVPRQSALAQTSANHLTQTHPSQLPSASQSVNDDDSSNDEAGQHQQSVQLLEAYMHAAAGHPPLVARRALILSAEVNLDELRVFQNDLPALDVCLPPNTLVLGLTDGLCIFPALALHNASSDVAPLAGNAGCRLPTLPGVALQDQMVTAHAMPDAGSLTEQVRFMKTICWSNSKSKLSGVISKMICWHSRIYGSDMM